MGRVKIYDRNNLLDTAVQLFWKKGLSETSLADIEKSTGVNKSSLYAEFADKDDIFVASLERYIKTNGISALLDREPLGKENVAAFLKIGKCREGQRGCFVVNSIRESAILPGGAQSLIQSHFKLVKAKLAKNIEHTKFQGDPETCAAMILTFNAGLCLELNVAKKMSHEKIDAFIKMMSL